MKRMLSVGTAMLALTMSGGTATLQARAQEITPQHIYSETSDPRHEIAVALHKAKVEHKHVLLTFGGDWCPDCQMLHHYLGEAENAKLVARDYILVDVWIGHMDKNIDLAAEYGVPLKKGVPAVSVLDADGKVLHAQSAGEFANMRSMPSSAVTEFLNRWKA